MGVFKKKRKKQFCIHINLNAGAEGKQAAVSFRRELLHISTKCGANMFIKSHVLLGLICCCAVCHTVYDQKVKGLNSK